MKKGLGIFNRKTRRRRPAKRQDNYRRDDYYRNDDADYADDVDYEDDAEYEDEYADEDYPDEDYEDGEYADEDFSDEDYEDGEYADEDYPEEDHEDGNNYDNAADDDDEPFIETESWNSEAVDKAVGIEEPEEIEESPAFSEGSNIIHVAAFDRIANNITDDRGSQNDDAAKTATAANIDAESISAETKALDNTASLDNAAYSDEEYYEDEDYSDKEDYREEEKQDYSEEDVSDGDDYDPEYDEDDDSYEDEEFEREYGDESDDDYPEDDEFDREHSDDDRYDEDDEDDRYAAAGLGAKACRDSRNARGSASRSGRNSRHELNYRDSRNAGRDFRRNTRRKSGAGAAFAAAGAKIVEFFKNTGAVERIAMFVALLLLICGISLAGFYSKALDRKSDIDAFAEIGQSLSETTIIGQSGLIAMADAQKAKALAAGMIEEEEEQLEEEVIEENETISVKVTLTSIKSDMKVKFINSETKKLISNVHFEIDVVTPDGTKVTYDDHDKDGIIYKKDITAGKYKITPKALSSEYENYKLDTSTQTLTVKDTVEMKAVDVSDEIKKESQINAAVEDTAEKTAVESQLTDTVEWVESNQNSSSSSQEKYKYEEINRSDIPAPYTSGKATGTNVYTAARTKVVSSLTYLGRTEGGGTESSQPSEGGSTGEGGSGNSSESGNAGEGGSSEGGNTGGGSSEGGNEGGSQEELYSMEVTPSSITLKEGEEATISVAGPSSPEFSSSDSGVASVSGGKVTAVKAGDATITVSASGYKSVTVSVHVETAPEPTPAPEPADAEKKSFKISKSELVLKKGDKEKISVSDAPSKITFETSDTKIATIAEDGTVTAVASGTATITLKADGYNDGKVTVKVSESDKYTMELNATKITLKVGGTSIITAKGPEKVTFKSSKDSVATVDKNGKVTAVAPGSATITVSSDKYEDAKVEVVVEGNKTVLKDKDGNVVYIKNDDGSYREATYDDYYGKKTLYLRKENKDNNGTRYGWWTINGNTYYYDKNGNYVTGEQVIQGAKYSFNGEGVLSSSSGVMGIDVSKWNGSINWAQVRNSGVKFVIIRCGYRGSSAGALIEDPKFRANIQGATAAGLKVGVYFFTQAVNEVEAVEEASMAISLVRGYGLSYPIYLDVEGSGGRGDRISPSQRTANIKAFCGTVQNAGYRAGVYANKTWFTSQINTGALTNYKIWLAQYAASVTYNATRYDMWQYTSKGRIAGISGNVDMNISYN